MARHIGERRGRMQLAALGFETPKMLPYGTQVMVKTKSWDDFQGHWRARKKKGIVRGPDVSMSMTAGGYFVEVEDGKFQKRVSSWRVRLDWKLKKRVQVHCQLLENLAEGSQEKLR